MCLNASFICLFHGTTPPTFVSRTVAPEVSVTIRVGLVNASCTALNDTVVMNWKQSGSDRGRFKIYPSACPV
jgi:hypothetical protein